MIRIEDIIEKVETIGQLKRRVDPPRVHVSALHTRGRSVLW